MSRPPLTPDRALEILGVDAGVSRDERRRLFFKKRSLLKRKLNLAITSGLRAKYRQALTDLTLAFEALELEATEQALEVLESTVHPHSAPLDDGGRRRRGGLPAWMSGRGRSSRRAILVLGACVVASMLMMAGLGWRKLERDRAEANRLAAELHAQVARESAAQTAELARLSRLAQQQAAEQAAKDAAARTEAENRAVAQRQEEERIKSLERQARVALAEQEMSLESLGLLKKENEGMLATARAAERAQLTEGGWTLDWTRRRIALLAAYGTWLENFSSQHAARTHLRVATELLQSRDPEGAVKEIQLAADDWERLKGEPGERRYREVGRPLIDLLVGSGDWPEEAFMRLRADEPAAVSRAVASLKSELAYLNDRAQKAVTSDWRDRLLPLRKLAGGNDPDFMRWQPRFLGTVRVSSVPVGAALVDENGAEMGTAPARFELMRGSSLSLTAIRKGYTPVSVTATVGLDDEQDVTMVLAEIPTPQFGRAYTIPGLGLGLVWLSPGTFTMGSPSSEPSRAPDEAQVRVSLPQGFWLGKYEVTQGEWIALMGNNPSHFKTIGLSGPVETVSWRECVEFCRRLSERERAADRLPAGYAYTLPSEAQWEYACRAGSSGAYSGDLEDMGWYSADGEDMSHVVGQKGANAWGLFDMHGNVWEWCLDWYAEGYRVDAAGSLVSPAKGSYRVSRGGSWNCPAGNCRSALRRWLSPADRGNRLGFRLALSPVPTSATTR